MMTGRSRWLEDVDHPSPPARKVRPLQIFAQQIGSTEELTRSIAQQEGDVLLPYFGSASEALRSGGESGKTP